MRVSTREMSFFLYTAKCIILFFPRFFRKNAASRAEVKGGSKNRDKKNRYCVHFANVIKGNRNKWSLMDRNARQRVDEKYEELYFRLGIEFVEKKIEDTLVLYWNWLLDYFLSMCRKFLKIIEIYFSNRIQNIINCSVIKNAKFSLRIKVLGSQDSNKILTLNNWNINEKSLLGISITSLIVLSYIFFMKIDIWPVIKIVR